MELQWWAALPFGAMLASIAIFPLIPATKHWWEKNTSQLLVALVLGLPVAVWMWSLFGWHPVFHALVEYGQFVALLLALFVVAGGIFLEGDIEATPRNNTIFLAIGGVLASFIGTTGAAMLLIRPLLATNRERVYRVHTVLFAIFIVANCGGLLTPLGDPPLFLGLLRGVPFTWTFTLAPEWAFVLFLLLVSYFALDTAYHSQEPTTALRRDETEITPLGLRGAVNFVWFAIIIAAVAFLPSINGEAIEAGHATILEWIPVREIVMLTAAFLSYRFGDRKARFENNQFEWAPILEVAAIFIGIFLTMIPALRILRQVAPSLPLNEVTFFVFTGGLSSILDNAPTYATFFEMAGIVDHPGGATIAGIPETYLVAISLSSVLCGAMTYIGNGPNFMVKSVAESDGVDMPSFGHYIVDSVRLLAPVIAAMVLLFIAPGWPSKLAGALVTVAILGRAVYLMRRGSGIEQARFLIRRRQR